MLRVCFILSNISDDIHALIHTQSLLESLELILTQYTQCIGGGGGETNNAKSIDVLIKVYMYVCTITYFIISLSLLACWAISQFIQILLLKLIKMKQ